MRRPFAGLLIASLVLTACQREERPGETLQALLSKMKEESLQFVYTEETKDRKVEVRARFEDTLRHQESLLVDNQKVLERVVRDDVLAVQVSTPDLAPELKSVTGPAGSAGRKRAHWWAVGH